VAKKGNGEGSIYPHKRNGKSIGYRGAYTVYTASGPKRRYVTGKTRKETRQKLTRAMADRDGGFVFDDGGLRSGSTSSGGSRIPYGARSARAPTRRTST
jgi:integrase